MGALSICTAPCVDTSTPTSCPGPGPGFSSRRRPVVGSDTLVVATLRQGSSTTYPLARSPAR